MIPVVARATIIPVANVGLGGVLLDVRHIKRSAGRLRAACQCSLCASPTNLIHVAAESGPAAEARRQPVPTAARPRAWPQATTR